MDDEVYIYQVDTKGSMVYYQLYEAYKIIDQGSPIIRQIGIWSMGAYSLNLMEEDKNSRRANLRVIVYFTFLQYHSKVTEK